MNDTLQNRRSQQMSTEPDPYWVQRLQATGHAQARYLWVLLLSALFYAALWYKLAPSPPRQPENLAVPVVDLKLSAPVVLASGPAVIALLVLIVMGALRAFSAAQAHLGDDVQAAGGSERFDLHPNALDLAVYTTPESPRWAASILYFAYPLALAGGMAEAGWLWVNIQRVSVAPPGWPVLRIIAVGLWLPALYLLLDMFWRRIGRARHGGHIKPRMADDVGGKSNSGIA